MDFRDPKLGDKGKVPETLAGEKPLQEGLGAGGHSCGDERDI